MARTSGGLQGAGWKALRRRALRELPPVCGRCGGYIDVTLSGRDPMGPHLDHRHPRMLGGEEVPSDLTGLMLSHASCNASHGSRMRARVQRGRKANPPPQVFVGPPGMERSWDEW